MTAQMTPALLEGWVLPTAGKIQEIATREGIDAATTQLYQSVLESSQHGAFIRRLDEISTRTPPRKWHAEAPLFIRPSAFQRGNPRPFAGRPVPRAPAQPLARPARTVP